MGPPSPDLLVAAGEAAAERELGILIAIDEVQYLTAEELGAATSAIHRTTQLNLPVVLVGTGLPQIPGLAGNAKSYAERLFEFLSIGSLSVADATDALVVPAEAKGVGYSEDTLTALLEATEGYPTFCRNGAITCGTAVTGQPLPPTMWNALEGSLRTIWTRTSSWCVLTG